MKITFITPHVGRKSSKEYVRTWQMEPLNIATLAGLTPPDVELAYFDERVEPINFDAPTDLAAITVETYTAKRAYEVAAEYHRRGVKTLLGGYHVTLVPDEAQVYAGLETGRGCPLHCNFCSIAAATSSRYYARSIDSIVTEIASLKNRNVFFVDDNFVGNLRHARDLCRELIPLKINWVGQGTLNMARDVKLLEIMAESGCAGVLIGFESLRHDTLQLMDKQLNVVMGDYKTLIDRLHQHGIGLYGTFIFGYDSESAADTMRTAESAIDFGLFIAAFNHLLPFPGTPLYEQFRHEGKLTDEQWWLSPTFRFGDVPFTP